jgi:mismatch-specific thymine-DNA glycosylase
MTILGMSSTTNTERLPELPDYLTPGLKVIFVGFNPSIYSAQAGHYYARPANQFWRCLNQSGLLPQGVNLGAYDDSSLPRYGLGLTDVVKRPTRSCNDLRASDYEFGVAALRAKLERCVPKVVAFNGKGVYEAYQRFGRVHRAPAQALKLGLQQPDAAGIQAFVLPSTSPINARLSPGEKLGYFQGLAAWVRQYA